MYKIYLIFICSIFFIGNICAQVSSVHFPAYFLEQFFIVPFAKDSVSDFLYTSWDDNYEITKNLEFIHPTILENRINIEQATTQTFASSVFVRWNDTTILCFKPIYNFLISNATFGVYIKNVINDKEYNQSDKINFKKIITQNNDGSLTGIEIINSKLLIIYYRDWQEKLNRYVLLQLVGDKVEILPVATAFPFLPPEAYENNNPNPSSNE